MREITDVMTESSSIRDSTPTGVVAVICREKRFLVIRRSQHVRAPGAYCFPGGGVEAGETEAFALCRELDEELSASIDVVGRLWQCVTPSGIRLGWWQANLQTDSDLRANPAEVASIHWLTSEQVLHLPGLLQTNRQFLAAVANGRVQLQGS